MRKIIKNKNLAAFLVAVLLLSPLVGKESAVAAPIDKNIMVIHQYSSDHPYHVLFNQGMREVFAEDQRYSYDFSFEYLEIDKLPHDAVYLGQTIEHLRYKTEHSIWQPDVLVTSDGVSNWLLKYKKDLPSDVPVVACAPDYGSTSDISIDAFSEHYLLPKTENYKENIELILELLPETKQVYVVIGNSSEEQKSMKAVTEATSGFDEQLDFVFTNELAHEEMLATLSAARSDSAVLYLRWMMDIDGISHVPERVIEDVVDAVSVPVFGVMEQYLGTGVIGGYVYQVSKLGQDAARMAIDVIDGKDTAAFVQQDSYSNYVFDQRALDRWNIEAKLLPAESEIQYADVSFWDQYGKYLVIGVVVIVLETALIITLIYNNRRRVRAEAELRRLNETLEKMVNERTLELLKANRLLEKLNKQLDHTARIDPLTQLYNRRHIDERLGAEMEEFRRTGQEFTVMIVDIDDFKLTNDNFGHEAGDDVLKTMASILLDNVRKYDVVSRWGGEEFLLLFPNLSEEDAMSRAEVLCDQISQYPYTFNGHSLSITVTIGAATVREHETIEDLIHRADLALYVGKEYGKNQCIMAD
ncbi:MAG: ABC transporter substrate binding protein [Eubacteriales bacterium]|nr:ABC transporter substrate binding protein [Eubacteriales bacterium]